MNNLLPEKCSSFLFVIGKISSTIYILLFSTIILDILVIYAINILSYWKLFALTLDKNVARVSMLGSLLISYECFSLLFARAHSTVRVKEKKILIASLVSTASASVHSHEALSFYFFSESPGLHVFVNFFIPKHWSCLVYSCSNFWSDLQSQVQVK